MEVVVAEVHVPEFLVVEVDGVEEVVFRIACYSTEFVFENVDYFAHFFVVSVVGVVFVRDVDLYFVAYVVFDCVATS